MSTTEHDDAGSPGTAPLAVEAQNLRIGFTSPRTREHAEIVHGVSFTLEPGKALGIVGESGSGKSLTARSLVGLVGDGSRVEAEKLAVRGSSVLDLSERQWRSRRGRDIGFVLQDALVSLNPMHTAGRAVEEALKLHTRLPKKTRRARALEQLARVGIPDPEIRYPQYPHELSGGLRQRALIASATVQQPPLLIADEPTTALDATVQKQIIELLKELKEAGTALLVISHDLSAIADLADDILVMHQGEQKEYGPADQVLRSPQHSYTKKLLVARPGRVLREHSTEGATHAPATGTSTVVLSAHAVSKSFDGPRKTVRHAVQEASFALRRGTTLGIVGESGSGKSTLARLVLGLESLDAGEVEFLGEPWGTLSSRQRLPRRPRLGFVQQDPLSSFDPRYTVDEVIAQALTAAGIPRGTHRARTEELLEDVGLSGKFGKRRPARLSGGERQRVAIARALATGPEVIIADEAVSALDVSVQAQILDLLARLQAEKGVAYMFISHDLGVIRHISHEVLVMKDGAIVESGPTEQIFASPGHDYTRLLLEATSTSLDHLDADIRHTVEQPSPLPSPSSLITL
ncbi:dipeptide ABC transporter ATP-binding protein [Nesterenkonia alkaliphila]|uniref:Dipeptide ABC transporter ATP-binding protein n=1 Tax=Nesterenkonia alkaliphila TaxID=1463631 RepID=A0A7K1UL92_9MICC|nr:ABC transporter ATP-binding protein [Nesterenkonia alkaliphila]MVT27229.1 dipeptide ABC transporter ATP-binding protein [Nesterenkonia alkaliphila]GFZ78433.1 ABC transporter ATP-binding protein [Nesterenkonia alkaliphila]